MRRSTNRYCERVFSSSAKLQLQLPVRGLERRMRVQNVALKTHFPISKCLCSKEQKCLQRLFCSRVSDHAISKFPPKVLAASVLVPHSVSELPNGVERLTLLHRHKLSTQHVQITSEYLQNRSRNSLLHRQVWMCYSKRVRSDRKKAKFKVPPRVPAASCPLLASRSRSSPAICNRERRRSANKECWTGVGNTFVGLISGTRCVQ